MISLLLKLLGDPNERKVKNIQGIIDHINALEPQFEQLTDEELRAKTDEFKAILEKRPRSEDFNTDRKLEKEALNYTVIDSYYRISSFEALKQAIYNNGAAVISIPCWATFLYQKKVEPRKEYTSTHSNHLLCAIGWDGDYIICQDSYSSLAHFNGGLVYIHKDYKKNEMWSVKLKTNIDRPQYTPTNEEKYLGYVKYLFQWLFGWIVGK